MWDVQLEPNGHSCGLTVEGTWLVAELLHGGDSFFVEDWIDGLGHVDSSGGARGIDDHFEDDGAVCCEDVGAVLACGERDGANEFRCDDSGGDADGGGAGRGVIGRLEVGEGDGLEEGGLQDGRRGGLSWRLGLRLREGESRDKGEDGHSSTHHVDSKG